MKTTPLVIGALTFAALLAGCSSTTTAENNPEASASSSSTSTTGTPAATSSSSSPEKSISSSSSSAESAQTSEAPSAESTQSSVATGTVETASPEAAASPNANTLPVTTTPNPGESPTAISNTDVVSYIAADPTQYQRLVGPAQPGTLAFNYNDINCYLAGGQASCNGYDPANNVNFFFSDHGYTSVPADQPGAASDMAPAQNTLPDGYQLSSQGASCRVGQHTLICENASGSTFGVGPDGYFQG